MLHHMAGLDTGVVLDLLAAAKAGDGNRRGTALSNRWEEPLLADRPGNIIMLLLMAKGARHPAAARIHFFGGVVPDIF